MNSSNVDNEDSNPSNFWLRQGADVGIALSSAAKQEVAGAKYAAKSPTQNPAGGIPQLVGDFLYRLCGPIVRLKNRSKRALRREFMANAPTLASATAALLKPEIDSLRAMQIEILSQMSSTMELLARSEHYSCAAAKRQAINCASGDVLVRTEVGYLLCSNRDPALLASLIETGDMEPGTRKIIQAILKPGDVFIDIGANIGFHTIAAARALNGRGKIIALEPFGPTKRLLEGAIWINGFSTLVEVHEAAAAETPGERTLYLGKTSGHHSLYPVSFGAAAENVSVLTIRIDDIVARDQNVRLIKIDAEGAELSVLSGAVSVISRCPDISLIVEFGRTHLERTGHATRDWFAAFIDLGFHPFIIDECSGAITGLLDENLNELESANILFSRERTPNFYLS